MQVIFSIRRCTRHETTRMSRSDVKAQRFYLICMRFTLYAYMCVYTKKRNERRRKKEAFL